MASATSPSSSPYVNRLPDAECTTAVDCRSWLAMASKIGSRGNVEANLIVAEEWRGESNWSTEGVRQRLRRSDGAFLTLNITAGEGGEEKERGMEENPSG